jgi:hypothetical protein
LNAPAAWAISREHFDKSYFPPVDMSFANSDALFPQGNLRSIIATGFEAQCRVLCFGPFPNWDQVQARLEAIRALLLTSRNATVDSAFLLPLTFESRNSVVDELISQSAFDFLAANMGLFDHAPCLWPRDAFLLET